LRRFASGGVSSIGWKVLAFLALFVLALAGGGPLGGAPAPLGAAADPVIAAAGDIACDPSTSSFNAGNGTSNSCHQKYTSDLLVGAGLASVLDLGDNQYYCGGYQAFMQSYDTSWGRVKDITRPAIGNHEYLTSGGTGCDSANAGANGYFTYFGAAAGAPGKGYYSYDVGSWHLVALNSNCSDAGGCSPSSPQGKWLASDLASHPSACTLAYWHIPLFSSGGRAAQNSKWFWQTLYDAGADVVLNGHDHIYERFAPQNPSGQRDDSRGLREFIVGTGGANHTTIATVAANSEVRNASTYGVLRLTLHPTSYEWQFAPEAGGTFTDAGSEPCHGAADTTPPSAPSGLTVGSVGLASASLSWSPATDDTGVAGYNVYRDGSLVGSTATTGFVVDGLSCGTTYAFAVEAYDAAGNVSGQAQVGATTSACPLPPLFSDGFESGDLSRWTTVAGLQATSAQAHSGSWSARATTTSGGTAYALAQLDAAQADLYTTLWFKVDALGANVVDLLKLRTASGAALLTVFASPTGVLGYQNNVTTLSTYSGTAVSWGAWHSLTVHVVIAGAASQVETWLDDQPVADLTKTESLGTTPVGRLQVGENISGRAYDVAFDDVAASLSRITGS
jgi:Fibronectin type III domain